MQNATSIGRKGEVLFRGYCVDHDVTCNKAYDDDYGWDYFIEFPPDKKPNTPIDMHPAHSSALVQVKATRNYGSMSCQLKLSNALRMAKSPQPFFLVLIQIKRGQEPRVFVRHVWTDFITQALRAGRIADNQRKTDTHRQSITITFSAEDEHTSDLIPFIKSEIEGAGDDYIAAKRKIVDTVGFESGHGTIKVTFEMETEDDLFDFLLGRRESLDLTRFEYISERFGIPAGEMEVTEGPAKFYVDPGSKPAMLRLRSGKGDERIVPAAVTHAYLPDENGGRGRTRIVAGCLEVIRGEGKNTAHATISPENSSLAEIEMFGTLQQWSGDGPVELLLTVGETRIDLGQLDLTPVPPKKDGWVRVGQAARLLRQLCACAMIGDLPITVSEIVNASLDLEYLAALASERIAKIDFDPPPDCPSKFASALGYMSISVGDRTLTVLAQRPVAHEIVVGERRELFLGSARVFDVHIERTAAARATQRIKEAYEKALSRLGAESDIFALGDLRAFLNASLSGTPPPVIAAGTTHSQLP